MLPYFCKELLMTLEVRDNMNDNFDYPVMMP